MCMCVNVLSFFLKKKKRLIRIHLHAGPVDLKYIISLSCGIRIQLRFSKKKSHGKIPKVYLRHRWGFHWPQ